MRITNVGRLSCQMEDNCHTSVAAIDDEKDAMLAALRADNANSDRYAQSERDFADAVYATEGVRSAIKLAEGAE